GRKPLDLVARHAAAQRAVPGATARAEASLPVGQAVSSRHFAADTPSEIRTGVDRETNPPAADRKEWMHRGPVLSAARCPAAFPGAQRPRSRPLAGDFRERPASSWSSPHALSA